MYVKTKYCGYIKYYRLVINLRLLPDSIEITKKFASTSRVKMQTFQEWC